MDGLKNRIVQGDCIEQMQSLEPAKVSLAFADPPFNIGYRYDVYDDRQKREKYLAWSRDWISAVYRVLAHDGTFWLAIGDEYAAELKLASQEIGFHCRSWVVWYYTFGVNCNRKFTRSHAHLFYFVKDSQQFTFRESDLDNRIPSARELVYNDKRANPKGRLPDDTWIIRPAGAIGEMVADDDTWSLEDIPPPNNDDQTWTLRPQDLQSCFQSEEDTWYFPRVAGTFKERAGFHGCQMPEQLLGRIIRVCSNEGDLVLDPFSGSATTLAVAKKLGRRYLGYDISPEYVAHGSARLAATRIGDRLDGSPEPLKSAPPTETGRRGQRQTPASSVTGRQKSLNIIDNQRIERLYELKQRQLTLSGIAEAFRLSHDGFSGDRVVADPELNCRFAEACRQLGIAGDVHTWNRLLFRLRKAGRLADIPTLRRTAISWQECDDYLFGSEIALQTMLDDELAQSLDEILCDPPLAATFDERAQRWAPGFTSLEYRWAALKLRKQAKVARGRGGILQLPSRLGKLKPIAEIEPNGLAPGSGVCLLKGREKSCLYAGETVDLRRRVARMFAGPQRKQWEAEFGWIGMQTLATETMPAEMLAWQSRFVTKYRPRLNFRELRAAT